MFLIAAVLTIGILLGAALPRKPEPGKQAVRDAVSGAIKGRKGEAAVHGRPKVDKPLEEAEKAVLKALEKIGVA